jgi:hypothetical protein
MLNFFILISLFILKNNITFTRLYISNQTLAKLTHYHQKYTKIYRYQNCKQNPISPKYLTKNNTLLYILKIKYFIIYIFPTPIGKVVKFQKY